MKTIVKFHGQPLNFWTKIKAASLPQKHVASVVTQNAYATGFPTEAAARVAVKQCKLDEEQITYHVIL
jgi:hypothetical protein